MSIGTDKVTDVDHKAEKELQKVLDNLFYLSGKVFKNLAVIDPLEIFDNLN
jgi:hypothetical protein